jgi:DegV family protein with EDD domain
MAVRIVTDSTADLTGDEASELGVQVVPLNVHFGADSYRDYVDLSPADFYARLPGASPPPRTSAPAPGAFLEAFERAASAADDVLCITISGRLSGSLNAARAAREHYRDPSRVIVFDSLGVTAAEANIVTAAASAALEGRSLEEVVSVAEGARQRQRLLVGLETLDYLVRGGRIGRARAFVGGILNVRPILTLQDGEVAPQERVRSRGRMLARLEEFALSFPHPEIVSIAHAACGEDAERLTARVRSAFPTARVSHRWIGPVVGLYTGPGALGVAVVPRERP